MRFQRFVAALAVAIPFAFLVQTDAPAQSLYKGSWIAESFGNDKVGGTGASLYFEIYAMPIGYNCNLYNPACPISSTVVTETTGGAKVFNPIGSLCTPIVGSRPAKGGTLPGVPPTAPLYRNPANFTASGSPRTTSCFGYQTRFSSPATTYLAPGNPFRGKVMNGAPVVGLGYATLTGTASFKLPAAAPDAATTWDRKGMARITTGSFPLTPPYLYSYTYVDARNQAGEFGAGKGFFRSGAALTTINYQNRAQGTTVASVKVKRGSAGPSGFGGVMQLLGQFQTKVCYFYAGGCGLGTNEWHYASIGATGVLNKAGTAITAPNTASNTFKYYNSGLQTTTTYTAVRQRFPWTTGTVTVTATGRGPHKTFHRRVGFDNRVGGVGTVQLVSPILTQWLGSVENETGGVAVMRIQITDQQVPEPGVLAGLVAGLSLLAVAYHRRR